MSRVLPAIFCGLVLSLCSLLPVAAADSSEICKSALMVPIKAVAFVSGVVFGTPIAVVRKTAENTMNAADRITGKSDNMFCKACAGLLMLPVGIFTGSIEGVYWGTANSWINSSEKPFCKESFSLGEMKD